ncbi:5-methylcytosine-specific restriction protein B [Nitrosospira sp. Nsp2]|uniref:AAA family ATPase n=1 Tax=Nitrosospira sp. Nsp2 TaxID=136548 RepID=UPI000D2FB746|nr:AAA family ATPase [Nitrosospira sp. Nsp2]PTR17231.1 5-methylcytosine-specific restriction protein B [Nitrosospira sp. Nsp2]
MARYNPDYDPKLNHAAAARWSERCLIDDDSILQDGLKLWIPALIEELDQRFVKNLDEGEGDFFEKLRAQLFEGSAECLKLMAEVLWILMLFQSNVSASKKRANVRLVWSWSGGELPEDHPMLSNAVLEGLGSAGTAYNTQRWREIAFLVAALLDFKHRDRAQRQNMVNDPWMFTEWLSTLPEARNRQLRHILPHLMFPDSFERISSANDKRLILSAFEGMTEKELRTWDLIKIDRALLDLRRRLETEHSREIDFYEEELSSTWKNSIKSWLLSWNPKKWPWPTLAADRASTNAAEAVRHGWRCASSAVREGDHVFLVRTGVDPKGIVAFGSVARGPYESLHYDVEKAQANKTTQFIDVDFTEIRDAMQDQVVPLESLQREVPDQTWNPQSSGIEIKPKAARILSQLWADLSAARTEKQPAVARSDKASDPGEPLNLILYGPPGTGKTYRLQHTYMPRYSGNEGDRFEFITFHQSYAYEDFVEGIRPKTINGTVTYEIRLGVLRRLCDRARNDPSRRYALFIDEINRGNVAKIFGELITLIEADKRLRFDSDGKKVNGLEVTLPYSGDRFGVPANVDLICTMNTADRSIALLDTALRRRFRFEELMPNARNIDSQGSGTIPDGEGGEIDLRQLLNAVNARLTHFLHRDQTIGHAYFTKVRNFSDLRTVIAKAVLPLLQEYFYDDWSQIRLVLADQTVNDREYQLVRHVTAGPVNLFPSADFAGLGERHIFEVTPEAEITPDSIRKIYESR